MASKGLKSEKEGKKNATVGSKMNELVGSEYSAVRARVAWGAGEGGVQEAVR